MAPTITADWTTDAACAGITDGTFDPIASSYWTRTSRARAESAIRVCSQCPVKQRCAVAGKAGRESGIWGGRMLIDGRPMILPDPYTLARCGTERGFLQHKALGESCELCTERYEQIKVTRRETERRRRTRRNIGGAA